jgi:hypothetical protein
MISEKDFFDQLIEKYVETTGDDLPAEGIGYYLEYFLNNYPNEKLGLPITKKIAARLIHEFMINILKIEDRDWGEAAQLKDIYDCRVCSNAIAQVYIRGIIPASNDGAFGLGETLDKGVVDEILERFALVFLGGN